AVAPVSWLFRLADAAGTVRSLTSGARSDVRRRLERHLGKTCTEAELRRIERRHFQFAERNALARVWPQIRNFAGNESCRLDGLQHIDAALAEGRGVILLSAHFGYARLIKPLLSRRGYRVWLVGRVGGDRVKTSP